MAKAKTKHEETEVLMARSKLDGVLQTLVDQKEKASSDKDSPNHNDPESDFFDSPLNSPIKKSPRINRLHRKRKLVKEETQSDYFSNTYLMRLFDRTVNLAAFTDDTPLYPVCRAWIHNLQPAHQHKETSNNDNDNFQGDLVYELPPPIGEPLQPTIPSLVKQKIQTISINQDSSSLEDIFLKHMTKWKRVKQKWKEASKHQEARYIDSYNILKNMYDKQNIEDSI